MAAETTVRADGFAEFAYVGEKAWHGMGNQLPKGAPIEQWTKASGMDWKLLRTRVRYPVGNDASGNMVYNTMDDRHVLLRSDTKQGLSIVSDAYKPVQPQEILEFFRDLVSNAGFTLETAGTLFEGRRFFALARVEEDAVIVNKADKVGGYLLLATSCDGSMETEGRFTTVRVVCNNTLQMARNGRAQVKFNHRSTFDANAMKDRLGIAHGIWMEFLQQSRAMAARKVDSKEFDRFLVSTLATPEIAADATLAAEVQDTAAYRRILGLFMGAGKGAALAGVQGTAWGALNAVTEYVDAYRKAGSPEKRFANAQWGGGEDLKESAREAALALLG
jgi:phage/plasmid-like protein (TIGR03299 family)